MYILTSTLFFPPIEYSDEDGFLAVGGDLSIERLMLAYKSGIFPWYNPGDPILWFAPKQRFVLFPEDIKISKSMRKILIKKRFSVTVNTAFEAVITACQTIPRQGQDGTWITSDMLQAYMAMHISGYAHSIEVWEDGLLVGGLYGVDVNNGIFAGESMFAKVSNASKVALIYLATTFSVNKYRLIDCQMHTSHLESMGAKYINRETFTNFLNKI